MGTRVTSRKHQVQVDGQAAFSQDRYTLLINKPPRFICTSRDPHGRKTVLDLIPRPPARLYTVGRLDYMSEGLLLVTNEESWPIV